MTRRLPFQKLLHRGVGDGATPFPVLLHFTLDPYLIVLSVKQGGIKYHFLSLWYDSIWDWTPVTRTISEHSTPKTELLEFFSITKIENQRYAPLKFLYIAKIFSFTACKSFIVCRSQFNNYSLHLYSVQKCIFILNRSTLHISTNVLKGNLVINFGLFYLTAYQPLKSYFMTKLNSVINVWL